MSDKKTGEVCTRVNDWKYYVYVYVYVCLFESVLTIWCGSLLEDDRAIPSV